MWSSKVQQQIILHARRTISTTVTVSSHYDVLGITPKATQAEVKAAYYKLSKLHHPDTSGTSNDCSEKFRLISEAYEVLGNYRSRQLYDKGLHGLFRIHSKKDKTPDHPKMSFYQSRMNKEKVPSFTQQSIYDFDEWTRQHYTKSFNSQVEGRTLHKKSLEGIDPREIGDETAMKLAMFSFFVVFISLCILSKAGDHDAPQQMLRKDNSSSNRRPPA